MVACSVMFACVFFKVLYIYSLKAIDHVTTTHYTTKHFIIMFSVPHNKTSIFDCCPLKYLMFYNID